MRPRATQNTKQAEAIMALKVLCLGRVLPSTFICPNRCRHQWRLQARAPGSEHMCQVRQVQA